MIVVRGGGDIATGTIYRLYQCGYRVLILETDQPTAIRRKVAFCEAVYEGIAVVEGVACRRIYAAEECQEVWNRREIPLLVDRKGKSIEELHPEVVIDAILAKRNLGTFWDMAPVTIALGPGFCAGEDVDYVVETMRGHRLGRIIEEGCAIPNTGVPGIVGGFGAERVIHAPAAGLIRVYASIGDIVEKGQVIAGIESRGSGEDKMQNVSVTATLTGVLRGIIRDGFPVTEGLKIADIDPRKEQQENCDTISDKARCIAGSVLEIVVRNRVKREEVQDLCFG